MKYFASRHFHLKKTREYAAKTKHVMREKKRKRKGKENHIRCMSVVHQRKKWPSAVAFDYVSGLCILIGFDGSRYGVFISHSLKCMFKEW